MSKYLLYGILFWTAVGGLLVVAAKPVEAQFKPCVWPNRCAK